MNNVFGLDIGTRNVVGTVGYQTDDKEFVVTAQYVREHDPYAIKFPKIAKHCRFSGTYTTCYSYKNHTVSFSVINAHHTSHSHTRCPPPWIPSCPPHHASLSPEA